MIMNNECLYFPCFTMSSYVVLTGRLARKFSLFQGCSSPSFNLSRSGVDMLKIRVGLNQTAGMFHTPIMSYTYSWHCPTLAKKDKCQ